MHFFCVIWILFFIFWVRLEHQADDAKSKWGWIRALHNNLRSAGVKNLFLLYRNLNLEFILLITFRAIDSPDIVSFNIQPKYVTFECCFICIFFYLIFSFGTLFIYFTFRSEKDRFSLIFIKANAKSIIYKTFTDICKIFV